MPCPCHIPIPLGDIIELIPALGIRPKVYRVLRIQKKDGLYSLVLITRGGVKMLSVQISVIIFIEHSQKWLRCRPFNYTFWHFSNRVYWWYKREWPSALLCPWYDTAAMFFYLIGFYLDVDKYVNYFFSIFVTSYRLADEDRVFS